MVHKIEKKLERISFWMLFFWVEFKYEEDDEPKERNMQIKNGHLYH